MFFYVLMESSKIGLGFLQLLVAEGINLLSNFEIQSVSNARLKMIIMKAHIAIKAHSWT